MSKLLDNGCAAYPIDSRVYAHEFLENYNLQKFVRNLRRECNMGVDYGMEWFLDYRDNGDCIMHVVDDEGRNLLHHVVMEHLPTRWLSAIKDRMNDIHKPDNRGMAPHHYVCGDNVLDVVQAGLPLARPELSNQRVCAELSKQGRVHDLRRGLEYMRKTMRTVVLDVINDLHYYNDINDVRDGDMPMHHIIRNYDVECVKKAVWRGADLTAQNDGGFAPVETAFFTNFHAFKYLTRCCGEQCDAV